MIALKRGVAGIDVSRLSSFPIETGWHQERRA